MLFIYNFDILSNTNPHIFVVEGSCCEPGIPVKRYSWPADHSDSVNSVRKATESLNPSYIETNMQTIAKTTHRPPDKKSAKNEVKFYKSKNHESNYSFT